VHPSHKTRARLVAGGALVLLLFVAGLILLSRGQPLPTPKPVTQAGPPAPSGNNERSVGRSGDSQGPPISQLFLTSDVRWNQPIQEKAFLEFRDWSERFVNAPSASAKAALETEGRELARQRRQEIAALIQADPERALQLAVPFGVRQVLPESIVALLETRVGGRGTLAVLAALPELGQEAQVIPTFRTATLGDAEYKAFVYGRRLGEPTRTDLPLNGIAVGNLLAVSDNPLRVLEPLEAARIKAAVSDPICAVSGLSATSVDDEVVADVGGQPVFLCRHSHADELNNRLIAAEGASGPTGASGDLPEASNWTEGQKGLILIRVDFDDLIGVPLSDSSGTNLINNLNGFYSEMSYGRTGFLLAGAGSDVTPTFRMPQPAAWYGTNDNYNQLRTDARNAAVAAGYVLNSYDRDLICFGPVPGWSWSGLGYVGAAGAWLRNSFSTGTAGHELGHNYGLNHASFWDTSGQSITGAGTAVEYGDSFDTMGQASAGNNHFNVRYKSYLNWLRTNETLTVTASGTYRIYAHDNPTATGLRGLKIIKNSSTNYWVEFRQKFTANKWLMNGAGLRWAQNGNQKSLLLDTTPGSTDAKNDSAIVIGRTFSDTQAGIHITPIGKGNTSPESLDVVVNLGAFPSNTPPVLTVAADATTAAPGVVLNFSASASDPDGDPLAYYWSFGDGNFGTNGPTASKSWGATGEYVVRCTVTDMKGGEASASVVVTIGSPTTYRISGQVAADGASLEGVRVFVSTTRMAYTDSDGTYTLVGLPAGSYTVGASLENYAFTNSGFANPVSVGPSAANIDFFAGYTTNIPPTIITAPASQTVNMSGSVTFSVSATGTSPMNYQWQFNTTNIPGATASSYTRTNVQQADAGLYSVIVSNIADSVTSAAAVLTVNTPPSIATQPQSQTVIAGNDAVFTVTAAGTGPLHYQWRFNNTDIAGATAPTYTRTNAQAGDAGNYSVFVSNSLNSVTSDAATLNVNFTLVASATYGGVVTKNPDQASYAPDTLVTLTASPVSTFPFSGWSGDFNGTNNPLTVTLTANQAVTANFTSPVPDLIVDNPAATFTGTWASSASANDKYGVDYRTVSTTQGGATATATFRPNFSTGGRYDVYVWFPSISKGSAVAPFLIADTSGNLTTNVSQTTGTGGWRLLAAGRDFAPGTNGYVRLSNNTGQSGKAVVADAVRWVYSADQRVSLPITITAIQALSDGSMRLVLSGTAGDVYSIECSSDSSQWIPLTTLTNANGSVEYIDSTGTSLRFYRGKLMP
jgi:hypothetical protein